MPKRESAITVISKPGTFPIIVETSFTSTPQSGMQKGKKCEYKIRISYRDNDEVIAKAVRATVINCGAIASDGQFPFRDGEMINVDFKGQPTKTVEEELASILGKSDAEKASYLKNLQEQLHILQKSMTVAKDSPAIAKR